MATGNFALGSNVFSVDEGGRYAKVTIVRTDGKSGTVKVDYTTYNDSADNGSDYRGKTGTVTFKSGQTEKTIKIPILQDNRAEGTEKFFFDLLGVRDSANEANLLAPRTAVISILDDDAPNTEIGTGVSGAIDPGSFSEEIVVSGLTQPTAVQWLPDGKTMLIAEKSGLIKVFQNGSIRAEPVIDLRSQVNDVQDRGLLDMEVHPDFANNPYLYVTYVHDPPETDGKDGNAGPDGPGNRSAIVSRLTIDPETLTVSDEVILVGENGTWENISGPDVDSTNDISYPPSPLNGVEDYLVVDSRSHATGDLEFGPDGKGNPFGALYISVGDGASFNSVDPRGAARVQDEDSLSGKILRVDPISGSGLSGNPQYQRDDPDGNLSKVYAMGFRNTFRFTIDSSSGDIYAGDVGWSAWEEINRIDPVLHGEAIPNFGWPFYEGANDGTRDQFQYQRLGLAYPTESQVISPFLSFSHGDPDKPFNAIVAGEIYTGNIYPKEFKNDLFFADFVQGDVYTVDISDPTKTLQKLTKHIYLADILMGPDGYMYFIDLLRGQIGRWDIFDPGGTTLVGGTKADRISANDGQDLLRGLEGNDRLEGNGGDDTLDGGRGRDLMIGGLRHDTYKVDNRYDRVVEKRDEGVDTVEVEAALSSKASKNTYTLSKYVENLILLDGAGNASGKGNTAANVLTGNGDANKLNGNKGDDTLLGGGGGDTLLGGTGNDSLDGGAGNDSLDGGKGIDTMAGGTGDDTYVVENRADRVAEKSGEGTDTVRSSVDHTLSDHVEALVLTGRSAIDGTGNSQANALKGNTGANRLDGGPGSDTLTGGRGRDTFAIEAGSGTDVDTITDFARGQDIIDLGSYGIDIGDWLTLQPMIADKGGDAEIRLPGGDALILSGVDWKTLESDDFEGVVSGEYWLGSAGADNHTGTDDDDRLVGLDGGDTLTAGSGDDEVMAGGGDDRVIAGDGAGNDTYHGGDGVDTLVFTSATRSVNVNIAKGTATGRNIGKDGFDGFENVIGGQSHDKIYGNDASNVLDGGTGKDIMAAAGGDDLYVVDNRSDKVVEKRDHGTDTVHVQSILSTVASKNTYTLSKYVENLTLLDGAGDAGAKGNADANVLTGNDGANRLDGYRGDDTLQGGDGDDTYLVDSAGDVVTEKSNGGVDRVLSSVTHTLAANVEHLELTGRSAIDGSGNDAGNALMGNQHDNRLAGGAGTDTVTGGRGRDTFVHNPGDGEDVVTDFVRGQDVIDLSGHREKIGDWLTLSPMVGDDNGDAKINLPGRDVLILSGMNWTKLNAADFAGVVSGEYWKGTTKADKHTGTDADDILVGRNGNDTLTAGDGDDEVMADEGDDRVIAGEGAGNDTYHGGDGFDTLVYTSATSTVIADLAKGTASGKNIGKDSFDGFENLVGGQSNDKLYGDDAANVLDGGTGKDYLGGRDGDDLYLVDNRSDRVIESRDQGMDTVQVVDILHATPKYNSYTLATYVENLTLSDDAGDASAKGNTDANVLTGNDHANKLDGYKGDDTVLGGGGGDTLLGGDDDDSLDGGAGNDSLDGGGGGDTMVGGDGVDTFVGGPGNDVLYLDADDLSAGAFDGGEGVDRGEIDARKGVTLDLAAHGIEWAVGGGGADTLIGSGADETLDGGTGKDDLAGGAGSDLYRVDSSRDTIQEAAGNGVDRVESSVSLTLPDNVEHLTLTGARNTKATGNAGSNALTGNDGRNTLTGGDGNDTLSGGLGNDSLVGGNGDDVLSGGDGKDTLKGGDGDDRLVGGAGADTLIGGDGADSFVFGPGDNAAGALRDVIRDFDPSEDQIDLTLIGDLAYIQNDQFDGPNQIRFSKSRLWINLAVDEDGDDGAEMEIVLSGEKLNDLGTDADPGWLA